MQDVQTTPDKLIRQLILLGGNDVATLHQAFPDEQMDLNMGKGLISNIVCQGCRRCLIRNFYGLMYRI